jgi:hypothetical protein
LLSQSVHADAFLEYLVEDIKTLKEQLKEQEEDIKSLNQEIERLENLVNLNSPKYLVIAVDSGKCPDGWTDFNIAAGRFILGASNAYPVMSTGGRSDIPTDGNHRHPREQFSGHGFGDDNNDNQYRTGVAGGHNHDGNNMPPFVALKFCKRI